METQSKTDKQKEFYFLGNRHFVRTEKRSDAFTSKELKECRTKIELSDKISDDQKLILEFILDKYEMYDECKANNKEICQSTGIDIADIKKDIVKMKKKGALETKRTNTGTGDYQPYFGYGKFNNEGYKFMFINIEFFDDNEKTP